MRLRRRDHGPPPSTAMPRRAGLRAALREQRPRPGHPRLRDTSGVARELPLRDPRRHSVSLGLERILWTRYRKRAGYCRAPLLYDMRELMREQSIAGLRAGYVLRAREVE